MMRKLLEAVFRHKLLLVLPIVLIPGVVGPLAVLSTPPVYTSTITVWVDRPTYLAYKDNSSPWISPALKETSRLTELLRTNAFQVDMAQRTSLKPLVGTVAGENRINDILARGISVATSGDNILVVQFHAVTAQLSYEVCNAIVQSYIDKTSADQADQAGAAVQFYQSRLQDSQQQLGKASQDLRRYVAAHQADGSDPLTALDPKQTNLASANAVSPNSAALLLDPRLAALQTSVQASQTDVTNIQQSLTQAQQDAAAAVQGQQLAFQVLDQARMPTAPTRQWRKLAIYPIAGLVGGLLLSSILLILLVAADRSVYSESDLTPGLRTLGAVPLWKLKRVPKRLRGVATRRAIGAPAGAVLPAPGGGK
jgi:uncharacterized protein involved in exopolysaccharide biosynthesis